MHHLTVNAKIAFNHPNQADFLTTLNIARAEAGLKKYGTDLSRKDLEFQDWLRHALEEALDLANYLEVLIHLQETTESQADHFYEIQIDAINIASKIADYLNR